MKRNEKIYEIFDSRENKNFIGNARQIAEYFEINTSTLKSNLTKTNGDINEALKISLSSKFEIFKDDPNRHFIGNKKQIANHFDMDPNYFYKSKIKTSKDIEKAIKTYFKNKVDEYIVFENEDLEFKGSLHAISLKFDIPLTTLIKAKNNNKDLTVFIKDYIDNVNLKHKNGSLKFKVFEGTDNYFFGTKTEIAKNFKINYTTFKKASLRMSLEEAIFYCKTHKRNIFTVFKNEKNEFTGSKKEVCKQFGVSITQLNEKMKNGMSMEEAIISITSNKKILTIFKGTDKEFAGTQSQIRKKFSISKSIWDYYINCKSMPVEDFINLFLYDGNFKNNLYIQNKNNKINKFLQNLNITIFKNSKNEFYGDLDQISKHFNINFRKLKNLIKENINEIDDFDQIDNKTKITAVIEQSVNILVQNKTKNIEELYNFKGTIRQICIHFGYNEVLVCKKLKIGFSLIEAVESKNNVVLNRKRNYKGFKGNLIEICDHFNKDFNEVYKNLEYNHTLEWAMEHARGIKKDR